MYLSTCSGVLIYCRRAVNSVSSGPACFDTSRDQLFALERPQKDRISRVKREGERYRDRGSEERRANQREGTGDREGGGESSAKEGGREREGEEEGGREGKKERIVNKT